MSEAMKQTIPKYARMESGQRYGQLVAIEFVERKNSGSYWRFRCDCGQMTVSKAAMVRRGQAKSCGCLHAKVLHLAGIKSKSRRGMGGSPEYGAWRSMIDRCTNPDNDKFKNYGGRGIEVCERWKEFDNFLSDMEPRPSPQHSLDRTNNDGNYEPDNCRWATKKEQSNNRRNTIVVSRNGQQEPLGEAATNLGVNYYTLWSRLQRGKL